MLLRDRAQFTIEGVMPDHLHVIPVGDNAVPNRVLQGQDTPLVLALVPHTEALLAYAHHGSPGVGGI